jgi:hypothetical protein
MLRSLRHSLIRDKSNFAAGALIHCFAVWTNERHFLLSTKNQFDKRANGFL